MRIYEFSNKYGVSNRELLEELRNAGFEVKSHMSTLDREAIAFLDKIFASPVPTSLESSTYNIKKQPAAHQVENEKIYDKKELPSSNKEKEAPSLILEEQTVLSFAQKTGIPINELILSLLRLGILSTRNMVLSREIVGRLAKQYDIAMVEPNRKSSYDEEKKVTILSDGAQLQQRLPVVVVLGHVDHGKTTLLDFIRKTRVAAREKGGITQHLGAYEAKTDRGSLIFLDTPGHEAFAKIRARGVRVADVAVLVVAADDGIMPQTIEAIERIKSMNIPVVVAINKMDRVEPSRIDVVRRDLAQRGLLAEEWGGDVIMIPISAKTGLGIDRLLEMVILQAELLELSADFTSPGKGYILESKIEKGRGPVATLLLVHGAVKIGDYFKAGHSFGRVNSFVDSYGSRLLSAQPSIPVLVAGFLSLPNPGDFFEVVSKEEYKNIVRHDIEDVRKQVSIKDTTAKELVALIIKTDTNSSKEALIESIQKISKKEKIGFSIIQALVGDVNESDVVLAANTGAKIVTLHVKTESNALLLAQNLKVSVASFDIIYKLLESLEALVQSMVVPELVYKKVGEAIVRRVFDIKGVGVIAGCYVNSGFFSNKGKVIGWRGKTKIGEGSITSLQKEKQSAKQVNAGFECGFVAQGITNWFVDDRVECYIEVPKDSV